MTSNSIGEETKKLLIAACFAAIALPSTGAGPIEYGSPSELNKKVLYFVEAGANVNVRNAVVEQISSREPGLVVANKLEDAQFIIEWQADSNPNCGTATVFIPVDGDIETVRAVYRWADCGNVILTPYKLFARKFVAVWEKAQR